LTTLRGFIEFWRGELPHAAAARWASLFFTLHVLTLLLSVAASEAFLAAAGIAFLVYLLRPRPVPVGAGSARAIYFPPFKLPLVLFCLCTFNSVLWSRDPALGGFALRKLVLFLSLLLSVNLVTSARHLLALLRGLFLEAALAGLLGIAQFLIQYQRVRHFHPHFAYSYLTVTRIHGFMGHWMNFGGQQMLLFGALLAFLLLFNPRIPSPESNLALSRPESQITDQGEIPRGARKDAVQDGRATKLYGLALTVVSISLLLNLTRGVWLGCLVATLYVLARRKPRMLWVVPVLLLVVGLASPSLIRRRLSMVFHPSQDPSLAIRVEMWGVGLRMIREHPWVGVGPGNIPVLYTKYLPPGTTPIVGYHDHLHDNFVQLAAERGVPCLIAWIWFMLAVGGQVLRTRRRLSDQLWVADAAFAAWLAFLAEGFFEFNFGASPVLMVFLFLMSAPFIAERCDRQSDLPLTPPARAEENGGASHPLPQRGEGRELLAGEGMRIVAPHSSLVARHCTQDGF